jgi:phenylalanine-4-hydroxylase
MMRLPAHLQRYVVKQDYERYTPVDQAVWRYIMRQLASFLATAAHPCYLQGLRNTGIEIDRIPDLAKMSLKLEEFGWNVVAVSGFIPPAAFMELQAHGFLPVACDLRTVDHLLYTPAPDIVHEAAGHAPILIDPEFATYLKSYAQVASRAIISQEDMAQYEAIRVLSDLKEDSASTHEDIRAAELKLSEVNSSISHISEAALLGRMNWWTAEYGLVGSLDSPRIYGAGLLSSIEESRACLSAKVKKIPLTVDCVDYTYDITEMQPQLFVTPDFAHLNVVLDQLADRMAFRLGGVEGLERARLAQTVNTVQLESGLQITGKLRSFSHDGSYLQFEGPCQLSADGTELKGHSTKYHAQGFGSPVGLIEGADRPLSEMTPDQLTSLRLKLKTPAVIHFSSGVSVEGTPISFTRHQTTGQLLLISWNECKVTRDSALLFDPSWGTYDMAVGTRVSSVFGGPADRLAYGETDDFSAKVIPRKTWSPMMTYKHELYQSVRTLREKLTAGHISSDSSTSEQLENIFSKVEGDFEHDWLIRLEILELARLLPSDDWRPRLELQLKNMSEAELDVADRIAEGVQVFGQTF